MKGQKEETLALKQDEVMDMIKDDGLPEKARTMLPQPSSPPLPRIHQPRPQGLNQAHPL